MSTTLRGERGSVLIVAVIAMLIMGVLTVAFSLLANIEARIGFNYKQQAQAEALAEAGLAAAMDAVRPAVSATNGFTAWLNTMVQGGASGAAGSGVALGGGEYWAHVDNDCEAIGEADWFPEAIEESAGCTSNAVDANETAVITAWARTTGAAAGAGAGRARVRAMVSLDNPWRHVCSSTRQEGYCPDNSIGNPVITPSNPVEPTGPAVFDNLPYPVLGCSTIDTTMHGNAAPGVCTRQVVTGGAPPNCNDPIGSETYSGYFDCALTTPCQAPDYCPPTGVSYTLACVKPTDGRVGVDPLYLATVAGVCPATATGMVWNYTAGGPLSARPLGQAIDPVFDDDVGSCTVALGGANYCGTPNFAQRLGRSIYVLRNGAAGRVEVQHTGPGDTEMYGTLIIEGNGTGGCSGAQRDLVLNSKTRVLTAPQVGANKPYGYPLVILIYDPQQAAPIATAFQNTCAELGAGGGNTQVHGLVYSGGAILFNPLAVTGGVVAYDIQPQGSGSYTYSPTYGLAAPPPGFTWSEGSNVVAIIRKSFVVCTTFVNEGTDGTPRSPCP